MLCFDAAHPLKRSGFSFEDGPDGTQRVSTTSYPVDISGRVCREADLLPEYDLRKRRERAPSPTSGGKDGERVQSYQSLILVPTVIVPEQERTKPKRPRREG